MTPAELRAARLALGLTQAQLAQALDLYPTTVSRLERDGPIQRTTALAIEALLRRHAARALP